MIRNGVPPGSRNGNPGAARGSGLAPCHLESPRPALCTARWRGQGAQVVVVLVLMSRILRWFCCILHDECFIGVGEPWKRAFCFLGGGLTAERVCPLIAKSRPQASSSVNAFHSCQSILCTESSSFFSTCLDDASPSGYEYSAPLLSLARSLCLSVDQTPCYQARSGSTPRATSRSTTLW